MYFFVFIGENKLTYLLAPKIFNIDWIFRKKNLKVSYCQHNNSFQPKLARKVQKRQCRMDNGKYDVKPCREISE